jgi:hypothetical protein
MPDQVRLHICQRVFDAVTNAGLRAEVDDPVEIRFARKFRQRPGIRKIDLLEAEAVVEPAGQPLQPGFLQRRVVIVVEIVDPDDLLAALEQSAGGRRPDGSRPSAKK